MVVCTECGRENEGRFNFCLGCGANLKAQRLESDTVEAEPCPSCETPVPVSHTFCGVCGARLVQDTDSEEAVDEAADSSPSDSAPARLVLINPDGSSGETIRLRAGENVFGRAHGPEPFRNDPYLDPRHVSFDVGNGSIEVRDLDSLNGVYYRILEPTDLLHGDAVRIGRQLFRFEELTRCRPALATSQADARLLGAPRGRAWGRLTRLAMPAEASETFLLSGPEEVVGRERGSILVRDDGFISGRHARVVQTGNRFQIEDLRSSNGTFIKIRGQRTVHSGDLLLMGQQPLRAVLG